MKLSSAIENYVALRCSLGAVFSVDARVLRAFSNALGMSTSKLSRLRIVGSFAAARAFPPASGKGNMDPCAASSAISFLDGSSSIPHSRIRPHASHALSDLTSTRTMNFEGCWRRLLKRGALARGLNLKLSGPSFSCSMGQGYGLGKHCGCALATSTSKTKCFLSRVRSFSSPGYSRLVKAWPLPLPITLSINLFARRMNIPPASLRPEPGRRFGFGRSRTHSCVCGSERGFDDLRQTAGNRDFMISARPLQSTAWSPGIVKARTLRHVCPFWPPTWDM